MPLIHSSSNAARESNIGELISSGHSGSTGKKLTPMQAVAIGYKEQRKARLRKRAK